MGLFLFPSVRVLSGDGARLTFPWDGAQGPAGARQFPVGLKHPVAVSRGARRCLPCPGAVRAGAAGSSHSEPGAGDAAGRRGAGQGVRGPRGSASAARRAAGPSAAPASPEGGSELGQGAPAAWGASSARQRRMRRGAGLCPPGVPRASGSAPGLGGCRRSEGSAPGLPSASPAPRAAGAAGEGQVLLGARPRRIARSRRCRAALQHPSSSGYLTCSKCCARRNLDVIFLCLHVNVGRCCPD